MKHRDDMLDRLDSFRDDLKSNIRMLRMMINEYEDMLVDISEMELRIKDEPIHSLQTYNDYCKGDFCNNFNKSDLYGN
jgi:hypothetical protein